MTSPRSTLGLLLALGLLLTFTRPGLVHAGPITESVRSSPASTAAPVPDPSRPADRIVVLFTNDTHGRVSPRNRLDDEMAGGAPALWDLVQEERAQLGERGDLVLLDSGDFLFGGPRAGAHGGEPAIALMNELGYAAAGTGNHELDGSAGQLRVRAAGARFPLLCANLQGLDSLFPPPPFHPSHLLVLPRTGVRLGLVGLLAPEIVFLGPATRHPGVRVGDPQPALLRELDRLDGQGAEMVVALTHQGLRADLTLAREHPAIDLVIGGHYPSGRVEERVEGTPVLQARDEGIEVGRVEIPVDERGPDLERARIEWLPWAVREAGENPATEILARFPAPRQVLAHTAASFGYGETCAWILRSLRCVGRELPDSPELYCINRGAIRGSLPVGEVTGADLRRIAPFDNHLVYLELPLAAALDLLERSPERPRRTALLWLLADELTLEELAARPRGSTVRVVTNDYLASGRDGYSEFLLARTRRILRDTVREAMQASLEEHAAAGERLRPPPSLPASMLRGRFAVTAGEP